MFSSSCIGVRGSIINCVDSAVPIDQILVMTIGKLLHVTSEPMHFVSTNAQETHSQRVFKLFLLLYSLDLFLNENHRNISDCE